jgi:ABC-2 type transport system permease protein
MKRYIKLFLLFFKNAVITFMNHRFNFIMSILANIVWTISQVITLYYLSGNINQFQNWTMHELILMLGIGQFFVYTIFILYYRSIIELGQNIITGELDRLLTKPVNLKFLLSFRDISVNEIVPFVTTVLPLVIYGLLGIEGILI